MNVINQKKIIKLMEDYKFCIICCMERTSTLDGDYNLPLYAKTFKEAYEYAISYYVPQYFNDVSINNDIMYTSKRNNSNYYINSLKKAEINGDVFLSEDIGVIYKCSILQIEEPNEYASDMIKYFNEKFYIEHSCKKLLYIFSISYVNTEKTIIEFGRWKIGKFKHGAKKNLYNEPYYSYKYQSLEDTLNNFCERNLFEISIKNFDIIHDEIENNRTVILTENDLYVHSNYAFIEMQIKF